MARSKINRLRGAGRFLFWVLGAVYLGAMPASATFTLHGRQVDILSDGHALLDFRARTYLPQLGRWLQRDPLRYNDGPRLYEAFRTNPMRFSDPFGRQAEEPGVLESLVEFFRRFQTDADPFTGEALIDKSLRRARAVDEPNPYRRAFLEQVDLYQDATIATIQAAEPVVARGVGVVQTVGGVAEAGTGVVLVVVSEGLGAAPGTIFVLHGADVTQAGFRQVLSRRFTPTETYTVIAEVGYPTTALIVDVGISLSSGISAAGLAAEATIPIRGTGSMVRAAGSQTNIPVSVTSPNGISVRSLPVLNEAFTPNAKTVLQRLTATKNAKLGQNLRLAATVLRQPDYRLGQTSPQMFPADYGRALEKLVAAQVGDDPFLNQVFRYTGSGHDPDFVGTGSALGLKFDITTETARSIAAHRALSYGKDLILITYQRLLDLKVFPP